MPLFITGSRFDFYEGLPLGRNFGLEGLTNVKRSKRRLELANTGVRNNATQYAPNLTAPVGVNIRQGNSS